jgi:hypothetical protein
MFEEHSNVPKTRNEKYQRNRTGGPNPLRPTLTRWSFSVRGLAKVA